MLQETLLRRKSPEELGISSSAVLAFLDALEKDSLELHSFMLLRHGDVAAEGWWAPYGPERPHMLFSLSKSFTSTAVGLAVMEGRLSVDDLVLGFFPEYATPEIEANLGRMRVRHLLSMATGHAEDTTGHLRQQKDGNWVKGFLEVPITYEPGTHFLYNSGATYMLSAIVQKLTGQTLLDYLEPRLLQHLGIVGATWETCPQGINTGGWGLSVRTEDIAKFGQLYLQKGIWNDQRILTEAWVEEATASHISNGDSPDSDWQQGYGYQFWRCRHNVYRGDGAFGQYCVVMPEQDAVIAITSGVRDMQAVLNKIWSHLLPAMANDSLAPDEEGQAALAQKLNALALQPPRMLLESPLAAAVTGKRYVMDDNQDQLQAVSFDFQTDASVITIWHLKGEHQVRLGNGEWIEGEVLLPDHPHRIAASGTWRDDKTFVMTWRFVETPFCKTVVCRFEEDRLNWETSVNVAFGPKDQPPLQGRLEGTAQADSK